MARGPISQTEPPVPFYSASSPTSTPTPHRSPVPQAPSPPGFAHGAAFSYDARPRNTAASRTQADDDSEVNTAPPPPTFVSPPSQEQAVSASSHLTMRKGVPLRAGWQEVANTDSEEQCGCKGNCHHSCRKMDKTTCTNPALSGSKWCKYCSCIIEGCLSQRSRLVSKSDPLFCKTHDTEGQKLLRSERSTSLYTMTPIPSRHEIETQVSQILRHPSPTRPKEVWGDARFSLTLTASDALRMMFSRRVGLNFRWFCACA